MAAHRAGQPATMPWCSPGACPRAGMGSSYPISGPGAESCARPISNHHGRPGSDFCKGLLTHRGASATVPQRLPETVPCGRFRLALVEAGSMKCSHVDSPGQVLATPVQAIKVARRLR